MPIGGKSDVTLPYPAAMVEELRSFSMFPALFVDLSIGKLAKVAPAPDACIEDLRLNGSFLVSPF